METKTELSTIFCTSRKIKIADKEIEIKQIPLGEIPVVMDIVFNIFENVSTKMKTVDFIKAVRKDFSAVLKLIEVTTNLSKEEIPKINQAAAIHILSEVVEENVDFLLMHVLPALKVGRDKVAGLIQSKN